MISFDNVHKTYKSGVDALKGISFVIEDGEFVFIIGKSGSGKSTLMKCITCEEEPSEGVVAIDGFDISSMSRKLVPVLRRQIGMIYQDFRLIESKTVFENIAFAGEIVGIPRKSLNQTVQLVLNIVGLKDKADSYPQELSGGEQQRVAIARAMVNNPKIIVADEPTGNLDPETSENIMALLLDINNSGTTVVVCTHDSNLVDRMKKRVIEIESGLIARDEKDSQYKGDDSSKQIKPIEVENVGFAFGDDPAFEHDNDYSDSFDDEHYVPAAKPEALAFGDELLPEPEQKAAQLPVIGDEEVAPMPTELPETNESVAETAVSQTQKILFDDEEEDGGAEVAVEEMMAQEASVVEEIPIEMMESVTDDQEKAEKEPEILFGTEEKDKEEEPEKPQDNEPAEDSEQWMESLKLEDSDIDLDISEDD